MNRERFTKMVRGVALSNKSYNKIFCIGCNKTGTTTLQKVLQIYGFSMPSEAEQERRLTKQCFSTNHAPMLEFCSLYDAFQDMPFSQGLNYVAADALFPNSKFILSERDSKEWFQSYVRYYKDFFGFDENGKVEFEEYSKKSAYLYPGYGVDNARHILSKFDGEDIFVDWGKIYDESHYIRWYEDRNREIKRYFMDSPGKFLVIDVTKEVGTEKICKFLGIPENYAIRMPHARKWRGGSV